MLQSINLNNRFSTVLVSAVLLALSACGSGDRLANVGDREISLAQFNAYLKVKRITPKDEKQREEIISQFLRREALMSEIEQADILDEALIAAELNELKKELLINRYFDVYLDKNVTDDAIQNYYTVHTADFEKRKVHVAHILLRTNKTMDDTQRKAKLTLAQEAYSKIRAGQNFADAVKAYSEDTVSARKDGDLDWITEGAIDPLFSDKVFALQEGDISEPFETSFGYHVVKIIEGPVMAKQAFEAVKGNIRYSLRAEMRLAETERLLSQIEIDR